MKKVMIGITALLLLAACTGNETDQENAADERESITETVQQKGAEVIAKTESSLENIYLSYEPELRENGTAAWERAEVFLEEFSETAESKLEEVTDRVRGTWYEEDSEE